MNLNKRLVITKVNLSSRECLLNYSILLGLSAMAFIWGALIGSGILHWIGVSFMALLLIIVLISQSRKIIIDQRGIRLTGFLKESLIEWELIKGVGIYRISGNSMLQLKDTEASATEDEKLIVFELRTGQGKLSDYKMPDLSFHWRKAAWDLIGEMRFYKMNNYRNAPLG